VSTICCGRKWSESGKKVEELDPQPANSPVEPPNGRYNGKLDDKGRLKLPVVFQTYLAGIPEKVLFVTSLDRSTAQIYPIAGWRANLKLLRDQRGPEKKYAQSILFNAQDFGADAEMDSQGRITLNSYLRENLTLDSTGLHLYWEDGHILLFTEEVYQQRRAASMANTVEALDAMQGAGLQ
jgi:DNA-binding transcriptional regulator/RsmH inhibitor MraZ